MAAPQARFEFVATGDAAVNAQIEQVVNKLVKMKMQAQETGSSAAESMEKARLSTHLLNEELGLQIPRAMQRVMAMVPGLSQALSMAFTVTAAIGFVEIIDKLIEKMPELTDKMMGFGEETKKAFEQLVTANQAIAKAIEDNTKQALADTLLGLSGSALDSAVKKQLEGKLAANLAEQVRLGTKAGALRSATHEEPLADISSGAIIGTTTAGPTDEEQRQADKLEADAQKLRAEFTALQGQIVSTGKHLSHDLGDEGKVALEKLQQEAQKAKEALQKMLGGVDQANRDPVIEQGIATENAGEAAKLAILKDALNKKVITILQYNVRERQIVSEHLSALQQITADGWNKIVNGFNVTTGDGAIPNILFAGIDPFEGLRQKFTETQKLISAGLEEEAAKEKVISDQAKATGEDQYSTEQKLQNIRGKSAVQLQALADKMEEIAHTMGDAGMIAEADKLEAKLQDLRIKTASWGTDLKKAITQDGENLFVGLTTGAEGWAQAFQNAGQSILQELAKIVYQLYIVKLLQSALGGLFGGSGAGSSGNSIGSGLSGVLSGFGGGRASGGPVLPGMSYMVGENGPERLVMGPRGGGHVIPGGAGTSGQTPVQVNIHNYGQPMEQQQSSRFDGRQFIIDVVVSDFQSNGRTRQTFGG